MEAADLGNSVLDHLLASQVALVTNEELVDALDGISVNLLQPLLDIREGVYSKSEHVSLLVSRMKQRRLTVVGNIVYDNDTVCSSVV